MNCLNIFFKYFGKTIDMLKSDCLDMMVFSDLSNKILIKCASFVDRNLRAFYLVGGVKYE